MTTDTNQASEDELNEILNQLTGWGEWVQDPDDGSFTRVKWEGSPVLAEAKAAIQSLIHTEKLKLLNVLDKSMPTAEQLTTKYGYHMPEKQYGYKLALHDIREVLAKLEAEL